MVFIDGSRGNLRARGFAAQTTNCEHWGIVVHTQPGAAGCHSCEGADEQDSRGSVSKNNFAIRAPLRRSGDA
jgi:hypothetical protein